MANDSKNSKPPKKNARPRTANDLELLKTILDEEPELKRRVLLFMQKNFAKAIGQNSK